MRQEVIPHDYCDNRGMDAIDRGILDELRADARIAYSELGRRVGLSSNATADRVRRLQRSGVIRGFSVELDESADAPHRLTVFIDARLRSDVDPERFMSRLQAMPMIVEAVHVTGAFDYLLRAHVPDPRGLDGLIRELRKTAGVAETQTHIALRHAVDRFTGVR